MAFARRGIKPQLSFLVPATSLLQPRGKHSFVDKCVPKYNLGTRVNISSLPVSPVASNAAKPGRSESERLKLGGRGGMGMFRYDVV
jgi:hypothetical protein